MAEVILFIGLIFFGAHLFTAIFEKTKIPDVLLLIIMGIIGGPILNIVSVEDFGKVGSILSSLALIIILFESGVTLNIQSIRQALASTLVMALLFFGVSVAVISLIGISLLQLTPMQGVLLGAIVGGTSSAVVIPMVKGLNMTSKTETSLILESAITDVLCIVLVFGLLEAAANPDVQVSVSDLTIKILSSFFFAFLIGLLGSVIWLLVLNSVRQFPNTILSTFAFVFILYGIAELLKVSGAITALAFGFFLTNYVKFDTLFKLNRFHKRKLALITDVEKSIYAELVFIFKIFFFLFLGISIKFADFWVAFYAAVITLGVYFVRLVFSRLLVGRATLRKEASIISIMTPKGLAAAVLAGMPLAYGVQNGELIQNTTFLVVLYSIVLTAVLVFLIEKDMIGGIYRVVFSTYPSEVPAVSVSPPPTPAQLVEGTEDTEINSEANVPEDIPNLNQGGESPSKEESPFQK